MYINKYPGIFVVFEGLDGSGQTTQSKFFYNLFKEFKNYALLTKEPTGNSPVGKRIRRILKKEEKLDPDDFQKLYVQDRREHLGNLIIPSLKKGRLVISDRYFLSTCAFGSINLDIEWLIGLNDDFILPDITFLLDVPPEVCIERINKRGQGFEFFEEVGKLTKVRQNYLDLAKRFQNVYVIDGQSSKEEVFKEVEKIFDKYQGR